MSFLKYFSFRNLGHYIAVAARDIVKAAPVIAKDLGIAGNVVASVAGTGVLGTGGTALALTTEEILRAGNAALGYVADAALKVTQVADGTSTLTIEGLTKAEIEDFQAIAAYFHAHANANGVALHK